MTAPTEWMERRACAGQPVAVFFPPAPGGRSAPDYGPALAVCGGCPVRAQCRAAAEATGDVADGYAMYGQVVGGCAPRPAERGEKALLPCALEGCRRWFTAARGRPLRYCSEECSAAAHKASKRESYERRRAS